MSRYFFHYDDGLDANDGLSTGAPKKTAVAAQALALTGNELSFCRGVFWRRDGWYNGIELALLNPAAGCTINDYGDAEAPPTFDLLDYETDATGWSHLGSGRWSKTWANQVDRVVFGGNAASLSVGGLAHAVSTATDATLQWYWTGGVLHIYTGSAVNSPPIHYGGLAIVSANSGVAFYIHGASNFTIERIRTFGGQTAGWLFEANGQDNSNINLTDCEALYPGINSGFRIRSNSTTYANTGIALIRPVANMKTDSTEDEGSASRWGGSDGINVTHTWDDITITNPTSTRFRHSGLNCYDEGAHTPGVLVMTADRSYGVFDSTEIEYGRALAVAGSHANLDVTISGIKSTGQITRSQFGGTCAVSGCSWKSMRWSDLPGFESSQAVWFQSWTAGPGNNYMQDVTFQNNLIENCWSQSLVFARGTNDANSYNANTVKVYNNTFIDVDHYQYLGHEVIEAMNLGFGLAADQLTKNNNIITPSAGGSHVNWGGTTYTVNAHSGFTGNVENVEGYVDRAGGDYHPTALGGLKFAGVVGSALALDLDALAFNNPPSIAPLEYVEPPVVLSTSGVGIGIRQVKTPALTAAHVSENDLPGAVRVLQRTLNAVVELLQVREGQLGPHRLDEAVTWRRLFEQGIVAAVLAGHTYTTDSEDPAFTLRVDTKLGQGDAIASATQITIPATGSVFHITGTTSITSIIGPSEGRMVTFIFDGTPTFTDGSNLKLAGNLVATADDTITGWWDGTNFYETARAVN